jgi:predicted HAD superfamily Cof-like phosphohydrolase
MNKWQEGVKEFHEKFGHPAPDRPCSQHIDKNLLRLRIKTMLEEVCEYALAAGFHVVGFSRCEVNDSDVRELKNPDLDEVNLVQRMDALVDLIYFACGAAVVEGIDLEPIFDIVQKANMAKLGPDGKPILRADGKIMKPPGWVSPRKSIEDEVYRQVRGKKC